MDLKRASEVLGGMLIGGIMTEGDYVFVTNATPLANLDANEIVEPLKRVTSIADSLESGLLGKDAV